MIKKFDDFINEWLDSPNCIDVPGDAYATKVNTRNYTPVNQTPQIEDAMFESSYFHEFLDNEGKSEEFNKFLDEDKRAGSEISEYLKDSFKQKAKKK